MTHESVGDRSNPFFEHRGVSLRMVEASDLDRIRNLRNDADTWVWLGDPRPLSAADQTAWLSSLGMRSGRFYFVVSDKEHPFAGMVRMDEYDPINRSIRVGADVMPELRGKGFGTRIFGTIKAYCFKNLNVHRIWLAVLSNNERAKALYRKQGFQEEGRWRDAVFRGGVYLDYILMSILEGEYGREEA